MVEIGLEKAAVKTLETKVGKAPSQRKHATIAALKSISLVNVENQRGTMLLWEDHRAIVKMVTSNQMTQLVSWLSILK
ncbi:hypothetical protein Tco_0350274, partial [Tanacetum coccineum]